MTINCPKCKTQMILRNGQYGEFFFCPNNKVCGAKVIGKKQALKQGLIKNPNAKVVTVTKPDVSVGKVKQVLSSGYRGNNTPPKIPQMRDILDKKGFPYNVPPHIKNAVIEHLEWLSNNYLEQVEV